MQEDGAPNFNWQEWVEQSRWFIFIGLLGLILIGLGFKYLRFPKKDDRVEIIPMSKGSLNQTKHIIDIAGSVMQPGIYELSSDARIQDAITIAGGLSETADRAWIEKSLNRAEKLHDGQKIYIPSKEDMSNPSFTLPSGTIKGTNVSGTININSANLSQLESLWGIGPVTAEAIVSGRPYSSLQEILDRKIVKQSVWEKIQDRLSL